MAICTVINGVAHRECLDPPATNSDAKLVEWAFIQVTGDRRLTYPEITDSHLRMLMGGTFKRGDSAIVSFALPEIVFSAVRNLEHKLALRGHLGRVLVVEDDSSLRKFTSLVLTRAGYEVIEAEDSEKAIQAIQSGDNPLMVDSVVMDLTMPKITGTEAITFMRQQFPAVPIIVLTGFPDIEVAVDLFKKGIADYLVKPIESDKLLASIEKAVQARELLSKQYPLQTSEQE